MSGKPFNLDEIVERMQTVFVARMQKKAASAWHLQVRDERKMRMRALLLLSSELVRIREVNLFATRLGESVLEYIIEGDWDEAARAVEWFTFDEEGEDLKGVYGPLWENFRTILTAMCAEVMAKRDPNYRGPD